MYKAVLTLLIGLMLPASGSVNAYQALPDGSPEEQYAFALRLAYNKSLEAAEAAFTEYRVVNPEDERDPDALFWLGYIQYMRQRYERAAMTFSEFSRIYPDDARVPDTTFLIAESVSKFAPAKQACAIYKELPNLVAAPTDRFTTKLSALGKAANCGFGESSSSQVATAPKSIVSSTALKAAQEKAEEERQKRLEVEAELAALKAQKDEQQQTIVTDNQVPLITITQSRTNQRKGIIRGFAKDNVRVAEVLVNGVAVNLGADGTFNWTGFVPVAGKDIIIEAIDTAALSSRRVIRLERDQIQQTSGPRFDELDPTAGSRVIKNEDALALVVGISDYERTEAPAIYADKDAQFFHDYASLKLGIPDNKIITMINEKAEQGDVYLAVADWLRRSSKQGKSDIYIFFAGHGLASQDGEQMYLLPFDGRPRLLDKTAILRDELFSNIAEANPRSVTVFLDTCYSGATRGPEMLTASRPISIVVKESAIPEGFTVMTAAAGDQTAKPLEEAKHGMFSYFLMKGMEGKADANEDKQITAAELHAYVQQNVIQQSSGSQTPELQGDADRVLVRFQ